MNFLNISGISLLTLTQTFCSVVQVFVATCAFTQISIDLLSRSTMQFFKSDVFDKISLEHFVLSVKILY